MRLQRSSRSWSIECRIPGNLCDLSKAYFATTFLSSSPPTPASQSDLQRYLLSNCCRQAPALPAGWRGSFQALLQQGPNEAQTKGNPGLAAVSPPPAWTGFRRMGVWGIDQESGSVFSLVLESAEGEPLRRPCRGNSWFCAFTCSPARRRCCAVTHCRTCRAAGNIA